MANIGQIIDEIEFSLAIWFWRMVRLAFANSAIIACVSFQVAGYQTEGYLIDTELYQGPLDLLLELIEKAELDITRLALAQVTDQYIAHMHHLKQENPAEVSAFLVIAARLLQIKSFALLPRQDEHSGIDSEEDLGEALARQLILYKRFKQIAIWLGERETVGYHTFLRLAPPPKFTVQPKLDLSELTLQNLVAAAKEILNNNPKLQDLNSVVNLPRITIRQRIADILSTFRNRKVDSFNLLIHDKTSRVEIVVTFLALLELVKRHILSAKQNSLFGNIELSQETSISSEMDVDIEFEE